MHMKFRLQEFNIWDNFKDHKFLLYMKKAKDYISAAFLY